MPSSELDNSTTTGLETLNALLEKEYGYYEAIFDITEQEHGKFSRERPLSEIAPLLKKKRILVACIDEIEGQIAPLRTLWKNSQHESSPLIENIHDQLKQLEEKVSRILELDQANQRCLQRRLHSLNRQKQILKKQ